MLITSASDSARPDRPPQQFLQLHLCVLLCHTSENHSQRRVLDAEGNTGGMGGVYEGSAIDGVTRAPVPLSVSFFCFLPLPLEGAPLSLGAAWWLAGAAASTSTWGSSAGEVREQVSFHFDTSLCEETATDKLHPG